MEWLFDLTYEELINYVIELQEEVEILSRNLAKEKRKYSEKITKDYEDNRTMVADLLKGIVG